MNSLWDFYKKKFVALFIISFVMSLVIQYASTLIDIKELQSITDPAVLLDKMKEYIVPFVIIALVNMLFTIILQYYVIFNPLNSENNVIVSVVRSLKYYLPFLILMIIFALASTILIALGLLALIVGVFFSILYIMTLYFFILPILMIEGPNIGNTITRTFTLAHRNFWSNIGWVAVFIIILIVLSLILSGIILLPFTGSFLKTLMNPEDAANVADMTTNPLFIILSAAVNAVTLPLMPIFACILYFNGRAVEEQAQAAPSVQNESGTVRVEDLYAKPWSDDHPDNPEKKD
jgi:hypothetical protein